ncbi:MAG: cyclodeaminase/cyclohydrolase family protein, partial [Firmicutes bacterium]|nr:cyclodeaminase/cyclohydrolase family protein [Bacillota bacterium]
MKLVDMKVSEYLEVLKSNTPAPGGGSASALAAAQGI